MSAGIPIIASSVDGLSEILHECKVAKLVNKINENMFAQAINSENILTLESSLRSQLAINYSKKFSLKKMIDNYVDVYQTFF